jgi:hypothetical protein
MPTGRRYDAGHQLLEGRWKSVVLAGFFTAKVAAMLAAAAATVGGTTAAYTNSLPAPIQSLAHDTIGAPAPQPASSGAGAVPAARPASDDPASAEPTDAPDSPEPTVAGKEPTEAPDTPEPTAAPASAKPTAEPSPVGPDATGPAAFGLCNAWTHGGLKAGSVAYANLTAAAGGADAIRIYCAGIPHPGAPSSHPTGKSDPASNPVPAAVELNHSKGSGSEIHGGGRR